MRCHWPGPPPREAEHTSISRNSPLSTPYTNNDDTRNPPPNVHARFAGVRARRLAYAPPLTPLHEDGSCVREQAEPIRRRGRWRGYRRFVSVFLFKPPRQRRKHDSGKRNILLYVYTRRKNTSFLSLLFRERSLTTFAQTPRLAKPVQPHAARTQHVTNTIYIYHIS